MPDVPLPPPSPTQLLSLPRRRVATRSPIELSEASAAARASIRAVVAATRSPFGGGSAAADDLEQKLRALELQLAVRERALEEAEARHAEHERELAESEALLAAREHLLAVARRAAPARTVTTPEEKAALENLRAELDRQEAGLAEAKQALREREQFLEESEATLFAKAQAQQEQETALEQREEDLLARVSALREKLAATDPAAAAALATDRAAASRRDEFNE